MDRHVIAQILPRLPGRSRQAPLYLISANECSPKCDMWFRRHEDLDELEELFVGEPEALRYSDIVTPVTPHDQLDGLAAVKLMSNKSTSSQRSSKQKRDASHFYQEDVSSFKRVRLLQRKQQQHTREFLNLPDTISENTFRLPLLERNTNMSTQEKS